MADRYFVETPISGDRARLLGPEAHHLLHVMRAKPGDEVVLFDGGGAEFAASVEHVGRAEVDLSITSRHPIDREARAAVTLGVALPKGDRQRWLVEKAVELGVARLVPLVTERSNDRMADAVLDRLRRAVIEASKQCGRNRLMEIQTPQPLSDFLAAAATNGARLFAHPGDDDARGSLDRVAASQSNAPDVVAVVGPEGGFSDAEVELARSHGWQVVDLGPRILRVETAALVLATLAISRAGG